MTNRYHSLTVVLEEPVREDDAQFIINTIQMIKGVLSVKGNVANIDYYAAVSAVRSELAGKLWKVLHEEKGEG